MDSRYVIRPTFSIAPQAKSGTATMSSFRKRIGMPKYAQVAEQRGGMLSAGSPILGAGN